MYETNSHISRSGFCNFLKQLDQFSNNQIQYQKWILWLISIPNMYTFIYITVKVEKLLRSLFLSNFLGWHQPENGENKRKPRTAKV